MRATDRATLDDRKRVLLRDVRVDRRALVVGALEGDEERAEPGAVDIANATTTALNIF